MRNRLAGVQNGQCADCLGPRHQLADRRDRTGDIRMMAEGNDFHPPVELQRIEVDTAVVGHAVPAQGRPPGAPGQFLPRDEVGVVFQFGGDDDVPGTDRLLEALVTQHIRHQVQRFGGVLGEHQLVGVGADERGDIGPASFVASVDSSISWCAPPVHRAVGGGQKLTLGVENLQRLLRGRPPGIQVGQLMSAPPHDPIQDREVGADASDIQVHRGGHVRLLSARPAG